jgi:hypothetical protein
VGGVLTVNEIDYEQPGGDTQEFVELYNETGVPFTLGGTLTFAVGNDPSLALKYLSLPLAGVVPAGGYAVLAAPAVSVPAGVLRIDLPGTPDVIPNFTDQNIFGPVLYGGGELDGLDIGPGVADSATMPGSVCRIPNGRITYRSLPPRGPLSPSPDWVFCPVSTPGVANQGSVDAGDGGPPSSPPDAGDAGPPSSLPTVACLDDCFEPAVGRRSVTPTRLAGGRYRQLARGRRLRGRHD